MKKKIKNITIVGKFRIWRNEFFIENLVNSKNLIIQIFFL